MLLLTENMEIYILSTRSGQELKEGREGRGVEKAVAANNCDNLLTCHRVVVELVRSVAEGRMPWRTRSRGDKNSLLHLKLEVWRGDCLKIRIQLILIIYLILFGFVAPPFCTYLIYLLNCSFLGFLLCFESLI